MAHAKHYFLHDAEINSMTTTECCCLDDEIYSISCTSSAANGSKECQNSQGAMEMIYPWTYIMIRHRNKALEVEQNLQ